MDFFEHIKSNKELNLSLMRECDILFYESLKEVAFQENGEMYSLPCKAFAQDGSGGEFDFNCKRIYQSPNLLRAYCDGYISKIRENYNAENKDWDMIRSSIAGELSLPFQPDQLSDFAMSFYKSATRMPEFSCKYFDGKDEYICDSVLSDVVSIWVKEFTGMTKQELEKQ